LNRDHNLLTINHADLLNTAY